MSVVSDLKMLVTIGRQATLPNADDHDMSTSKTTSRASKTNSVLKVYKLVVKISPENFSSRKIKYFLKISPKSPQKVAFRFILKTY